MNLNHSARKAWRAPFGLKRANTMSGSSRWLFVGEMIGAMFLSIGEIVFSRYRDPNGEPLHLPKFIKARTQSLGAPVSTAPPAPIEIQLSADMIQVSAIALGHPRLAVINGRTVTERTASFCRGKIRRSR